MKSLGVNSILDYSVEALEKEGFIVGGTKNVLDKREDLTTDQALDYVRLWNTSYLISEELKEGVTAFFEKGDPDFK